MFGFGVLDKGATVASMESSAQWSTFDLEMFSVESLTSDVCALAYAVRACRGEDTYEAMVSSVYVERDGQWQLALHHETPRASHTVAEVVSRRGVAYPRTLRRLAQ